MKIGTIEVKISILAIAVFVLFTVIITVTVVFTGDRSLLYWGIPTLFMLLIIPLALNYMSQREYAELEPVYRSQAKNVRIVMINESMVGQIVRVEAVVERVYFQFLNRPQYMVADRSGEISVKMFTTPHETIKKGDVVEVLGMIIHRYGVGGDPVINCVSITKIDKKIVAKKKKE
jgi:cytochrome c-type biogenesis protein CcmH/NrfF